MLPKAPNAPKTPKTPVAPPGPPRPLPSPPQESRGRRTAVAAAVLDLGRFAGPTPSCTALSLPLRPRSRKVAAACLRLRLSATVLHEGHPA